jgi:hypothetical protein
VADRPRRWVTGAITSVAAADPGDGAMHELDLGEMGARLAARPFRIMSPKQRAWFGDHVLPFTRAMALSTDAGELVALWHPDPAQWPNQQWHTRDRVPVDPTLRGAQTISDWMSEWRLGPPYGSEPVAAHSPRAARGLLQPQAARATASIVPIGRDGLFADSRLAGVLDRAADDLIVVYPADEPHIDGVPLALLRELRDGPLPVARMHDLSGISERTIRHIIGGNAFDAAQAHELVHVLVDHARRQHDPSVDRDPVVFLATFLYEARRAQPACAIRGCTELADWGHEACADHKRALNKRRYRQRRRAGKVT